MANSDVSPLIDGVRIRATRLEDLKEIDNLLARVHFDVGVHILELYFLNSVRVWQVAVNEADEIVGFDSGHRMALKGIEFGFDTYVRDDYQNRGVSRRFGTMYGKAPMVGNSTATSMKHIMQFENYDTKLLGYNGIPIRNRSADNDQFKEFSNIDIILLTDENDAADLLKYDRSVFDVDRNQFMREWCSISKSDRTYARTLIAKQKSNGRIVGFGTLRRFSDFYGIMPLYADDQSIAGRLLDEMVNLLKNECGADEHLYVYFDAKNRLMTEFVHRFNLRLCDSEMRQYSRGAIEIKKFIRFDKVYAFQDYWPV